MSIVNLVIPAFENFKSIERIHYCDLDKFKIAVLLTERFATM